MTFVVPNSGIMAFGNVSEPGDSRSYLWGFNNALTGVAPPPQHPLTIIYKFFPFGVSRSYQANIFYCQWETTFNINGTVDYYGFHPYPTGAALFGTPLWEIPAFHNDFTGPAVDYEHGWFQCVCYAEEVTGERNYTFYYDWENRGSVSPITTGFFPLEGDAPDPALVFFDAPWSQGHECASGIFADIHVYPGKLTETQVNNCLSNPNSETAFFWNKSLTADDITDYGPGNHDGDWLATTFFRPMTWKKNVLGLDTVTKNIRTGVTDPHTFLHTPATDSPKGFGLIAIHGVSSTEHITSVTYNGITVPSIITAADVAGEPGRCSIFYLGTGVPSGQQLVSIDLSSATTDDIIFLAFTVTASRDTEIIDTDTIAGDTANPSRTMNHLGRMAFDIGGAYSGGTSSITLLGDVGLTDIADHDLGAFNGRCFASTDPTTSDPTLSSAAGIDDLALAMVSIAEVISSGSIPVISHYYRQQSRKNKVCF